MFQEKPEAQPRLPERPLCSHLDALRRPLGQTHMKLTLNRFSRAEGNNEGLYSGSDYAHDAWPSVRLQGGDAVLDSADLAGSPAAGGWVCG